MYCHLGLVLVISCHGQPLMSASFRWPCPSCLISNVDWILTCIFRFRSRFQTTKAISNKNVVMSCVSQTYRVDKIYNLIFNQISQQPQTEANQIFHFGKLNFRFCAENQVKNPYVRVILRAIVSNASCKLSMDESIFDVWSCYYNYMIWLKCITCFVQCIYIFPRHTVLAYQWKLEILPDLKKKNISSIINHTLKVVIDSFQWVGGYYHPRLLNGGIFKVRTGNASLLLVMGYGLWLWVGGWWVVMGCKVAICIHVYVFP